MSSSSTPLTSSENATELIAYNEVSATRTMRRAPRFGHNDEFASVFTDDTREDYLNGLVFIGTFVISIMVVWFVMLGVFRCLGPKRVGFLSGAPMQKKSDVFDYNRPFRVRVVFVNTVVIFIIFAVLLIVNGLDNLQDTVVTVSNNNQEVKALLGDAGVITRNLQEVGQSSGQIRDELVSTLGNFCPAEPSIGQVTDQDFDAKAQEAIQLLNELGDFINNDVADVQNGIDKALDSTVDVADVVNEIDVNDWQSLIIIIPYILLPSLLLVGVFMAWCGASIGFYKCILSWVVMPLFIILTVLAIVCCASVSILSVANADSCSGKPDNSPDGTVLQILEAQNLSPDDITYKAINYYVGQCTSEDPFAFIADYQQQIVDANKTVADLQGALESVTIARLNLLCGKDFTPLQSLLNTMRNNLKTLDTSASSALSLLSCKRVLPIYTSMVYGGVCDDGVTGTTWIFASLLVVSTMGMIIITLRSAYLDVEDEYVMGDVDMYEARDDAFPRKIEYETDAEQPAQRSSRNDNIEIIYGGDEQPSNPKASRVD